MRCVSPSDPQTEDQTCLSGRVFQVLFFLSFLVLFQLHSLAPAVAAPTEIILDNAALGVNDAAGGRAFTGTWCLSEAANKYGGDSLYSCGSGAESYRWTPNITDAQAYDVYVWWSTHPNRSTSAPISVTHSAGTATKNFNQQTGGGQWVLHGRYSFAVGKTGYVEVKDTNGQAAADAVRIVPVTTTGGGTGIIVDNAALGVTDSAGGRTFTGTWCLSEAATKYGADSLYSCGSGRETYRWTPSIPTTQAYDVYVWWSTHPNRSTTVPISVVHSAGTATKNFNQQAPGGQWVLHGQYTFNAGQAG